MPVRFADTIPSDIMNVLLLLAMSMLTLSVLHYLASFSKLISVNTDLSDTIETLSPSSFDPRNQYASALRAVRAAAVENSKGDESAVEVKVYRVEVGTSRVEYYITALDGEGGLLVGLRAKAIES
jgi:hypothetical protein